MTFIRSIDALAVDVGRGGSGRRMTYSEAVALFGAPTVEEALEDGMVAVSRSRSAAGEVLKARRTEVGLTPQTVASRAGISQAELAKVESSDFNRVRAYEKVGHVLGLADASLYSGAVTSAQSLLGTRLRTLSQDKRRLGPSTAVALTEASWVAAQQYDLEERLRVTGGIGLDLRQPTLVTYPPFRQGYELARATRARLVLGDAPIESMRALAEEVLGVPVLLARMQEHIAGATISVGTRRVIVLNEAGDHGRVAVRRATLAHELCHYLFDADVELDAVRVDSYDGSARMKEFDDIERRANAFAAEFLAPQAAVHSQLEDLPEAEASLCNRFGVSPSLMRNQAFNALGRPGTADQLTFAPLVDADWDGPESYTVGYNPINGLANAPLRAGRFSGVVVRAVQTGLISKDSAEEWLRMDDQTAPLPQLVESFAGLYPDLWPSGSSSV